MSDLAHQLIAGIRAVSGPGPLPLHAPEFRGNEEAYVSDCVTSGWVSSVGSYVDRFERMLMAFTGLPHAVAVSNGTAALHMAYLIAGVRGGDEVLCPALTFVATANAVSHAGATPHFVDADAVTLAVDPAALEAHLSGVAELREGLCVNRATGAVIRALAVTHVFGLPADMTALIDVARRWRLVVVEDAAEALGSLRDGVHVGGDGLVSAFSFNGNKIVTTGGGGAILTRDAALAARAKHLTTTARRGSGWVYEHDEVGWNYRLPNLNAALGVAQLERLDDLLIRKRKLADRYAEALEKIDGARPISPPPGTSPNAWLNALALAHPDMALRDELLGRLHDAGIEARPVWALMHRLPMYAACPRAPLPVAEALEAAVITLPSSAALAD